MFFMAIGPKNSDTGSRVVVTKMFLKNIKRHYEVVEMLSFPFDLPDPEIKTHIARLFQDNAYRINKRIFSQDKRPTRNIRANPKLVVHGMDGGDVLTKELRQLKIPAECIMPQDVSGWERYRYGKALGDDYRVGIFDLTANLIDLFSQKRLKFNESAENLMCQPRDRLNRIKTVFDQNPTSSNPVFNEITCTDPLVLLSLTLWFRETIPYNRTYKA